MLLRVVFFDKIKKQPIDSTVLRKPTWNRIEGVLYSLQFLRPVLVLQSGSGNARAKEEVRTALQGVSEWFDDYLGGEQGGGLEQVSYYRHTKHTVNTCACAADVRVYSCLT